MAVSNDGMTEQVPPEAAQKHEKGSRPRRKARTSATYFRYWMFVTDETPAKTAHWPVEKFHQAIRPNDVVLFWLQGDTPSIHAWGHIIGDTTETDGKHSVEIACKQVLSQPITKDEIQNVLGLSTMNVLRGVRGPDIHMSTLEADQLRNLIKDESEAFPPIPVTEEPDGQFALAEALHDYRYDKMVTRVLNASLDIAHNNSREEQPSITPEQLIILTLRYCLVEDAIRPKLGALLPMLADENSASKYLERHAFSAFEDDKVVYNLLSQDQLFTEQKASSLMWLTNETLLHLGTLDLLAYARYIAVYTTASERIQIHHLLTAILLWEHSASLVAELAQVSDTDEMRGRIWQQVQIDYPNEDVEGWRVVLTRVSVPDLQLVDYSTDSESGTDHLNIQNETFAFASLVSAAKIDPPLAVGLFGDWGSGKSFFMDKVRNNVDRIWNKSKGNRKDPSNSYCSGIVQVEFNAWHYVETDIYASIVSAIFEELDEHIAKECPSKTSQLVAKMGGSDKAAQEMDAARTRSEKDLKYAQEAEAVAQQYADGRLVDMEMLERCFPTQISQLKQAADELPVEQLSNTITELPETFAKLDRITTHLKSVYLTRSGRQRAIIAIVGAVGMYVLFRTALTNVDLAMQTITIGGGVLAWLAQQVSRVEASIATVAQNSQNLIDQSKHHGKQLLASRRKERREAEDRYRDIQRENAIATQKKLLWHIRNRIQHNEYEKHLGLAKVIREDLKSLSDLMAEQRKAEVIDEDLPYVDRIILYIDDLDRCPPDKVVDVLQAIRLLLAFPLFVVVVGVDVRWMAGALRKKYPDLLQQEDLCDAEDANKRSKQNQATAQDYLEKVFQIPFWVRPMDPGLTGQLIRGVIGNKVLAVQGEVQDNQELTKKSTGDGKPGRVYPNTPDDPPNGEAPLTEINLQPAALMMNSSEVEFMARLGTLAGRTPRSVKRFLNVYRVIKSAYREMLEPDFTATEDGGYREVLFLLAVVSAWPEASHRFFRETLSRPNQDLQSLSESLAKQRRDTGYWSQFLDALHQFVKAEENDLIARRLHKWLPTVARFGFRKWELAPHQAE